MAKEQLVKIQFWAGDGFKTEIDDFAHGLNLASADFYKAGALLLKNMITNNPIVNLNLFTRSFKDVENSIMQKEIRKALKESRGSY